MSKQVTKTVYLMQGVKDNRETCSSWNWAEGADDYILLAEQDVVFTVSISDADIVTAQVAGLEKEIQQTRADAQSRVQMLQDKIQSLLSITHQAEV